MINYGRHNIDENDIQAVVDVLRSDFLTTGLKVQEFETAICEYTGARYAVAVSSGTAALHCAFSAIGIGSGDEVIVPAITFAATANAVLYCGGIPVFADIDPETLLISPADVESKITPRTKAIIAMDYAGQPCDYSILREICRTHKLYLISDACHSLGASYENKKMGSLADITVFSFHPVKSITTGEGGMVVTNIGGVADASLRMRNHGRASTVMVSLGYNYRMSDISGALGVSQLKKLDDFIQSRNKIAITYSSCIPQSQRLVLKEERISAHHLFVIRTKNRLSLRNTLLLAGYQTQIHYVPVFQLLYYRANKFPQDTCPNATSIASDILSIPIYPGLKDEQIYEICEIINKGK